MGRGMKAPACGLVGGSTKDPSIMARDSRRKRGCEFEKTEAGMGVPAARPYNLGVGCWIQRSQERIFDNPVSLVFCCISDPNVVLNLKKRRPGWACLRRAPTPLLSYVQADGRRNGIFENFDSVNFRWSSDPNVVGAARREARPGLRVFMFKGRCVSIWHPKR